jgi:hypothetical protein
MVLLDSTGFKDSKGISFAIFGSTEHKIWILQDWNQIWFEILKQISVWNRGWHLADSDWSVPIRSVHASGVLDLKWSGRIRSSSTLSNKWSVRAVRFRSDGRRWKGERGSQWLGFRRRIRRGRAEVELRRCSGEFWTAVMSRRWSGRHGGLENLVGVVDCVLTWANGAAGGGTSFGDLRPTPESLIFCKRIRAKGIKGCARAEERKWARRGRALFTVDVGIVREACRYCGLRRWICAALRPGSGRGGEGSDRRVRGT